MYYEILLKCPYWITAIHHNSELKTVMSCWSIFFPSLLLHINKAEEVSNSSILIVLWIFSNNMRFYI